MSTQDEFKGMAIAGVILAGMMAGSQWLPTPLVPVRVVLGLAFVLLLPGYALQAAIFPGTRDLDLPERLALSFGLSVAAMAPLALLLDRLPWGLRPWPMAISLGLFLLACAVVARYRRGQQPEEPGQPVSLHPMALWRGMDRTGRVASMVMGLAVVAVIISAVVIATTPRPEDHYTEFYILGAEALAQDYPREAKVGQPLTVTMGITNREAEEAEYRVEVANGGRAVSETRTVRLAPGANQEQPVTFALTESGEDVRVSLHLYRDGATEPYRTLELWMRGKPPL